MDDKLASLLLELATDPKKLAAFARDRKGFLAATDLPVEVCAAILKGDQERLTLFVGAFIPLGPVGFVPFGIVRFSLALTKKATMAKARAARKRTTRRRRSGPSAARSRAGG